jgi:hypothetical protein
MIILENRKQKFVTLRTTEGFTYKGQFHGVKEHNSIQVLVLSNVHYLTVNSNNYSTSRLVWELFKPANQEIYFLTNNLIYYFEAEEDVEETFEIYS